MDQFYDYAHKALTGCKPIVATLIAGLNYLLFPDHAFATAAYAVGTCMLLDIFTKYVSLSAQSGGYIKAVKTCRISSKALWHGTRIKIYSYLIVAILVGLSYRVVQLEQVSVFFGTVVYAVLFLRETQSILENLVEAGADLGWLLLWTKQKEKQILELKEEEPDGTEENDSETI
jgi:phage-related holin